MHNSSRERQLGVRLDRTKVARHSNRRLGDADGVEIMNDVQDKNKRKQPNRNAATDGSAETTGDRAISREGTPAISGAFKKKARYKSVFWRSDSNRMVLVQTRTWNYLYISDAKLVP